MATFRLPTSQPDEKQRMILERGDTPHVRCDRCGGKVMFYHKHELYNKNWFKHGGYAYWLAHRMELSALLCELCHYVVEHDPEEREKLFLKAIERYGYDEVYKLVVELERSYGHPLPFPFPERPVSDG